MWLYSCEYLRYRFAAVGLVAALLICGCKDNEIASKGRPIADGDSSAMTKEAVIQMLHQAVKDGKNGERYGRAMASRIGRMRGQKYWEKRYPVQYARYRLISRGQVIIEPLLEIIEDASQDRMVIMEAETILLYFKDPRILRAMLVATQEQRMTPSQLAGSLRACLPVRTAASYLEDEKVVDWLQNQLATKTYDEIVLGLLDEFMYVEYAKGGMYPVGTDGRVLRWLNRVYDYDLDDWLANKAPDALAFRNRELAKGYDPAICFSGFSNNIRDGHIDIGIKKVFQSLEDRKACRRLIEVLYDGLSPLAPPEKEGWMGRLRMWYRKNRDSLTYDNAKRRFVAKAEVDQRK